MPGSLWKSRDEMLRNFFFLISFSAFPLKAENELISGGGTNGSILVLFIHFWLRRVLKF